MRELDCVAALTRRLTRARPEATTAGLGLLRRGPGRTPRSASALRLPRCVRYQHRSGRRPRPAVPSTCVRADRRVLQAASVGYYGVAGVGRPARLADAPLLSQLTRLDLATCVLQADSPLLLPGRRAGAAHIARPDRSCGLRDDGLVRPGVDSPLPGRPDRTGPDAQRRRRRGRPRPRRVAAPRRPHEPAPGPHNMFRDKGFAPCRVVTPARAWTRARTRQERHRRPWASGLLAASPRTRARLDAPGPRQELLQPGQCQSTGRIAIPRAADRAEPEREPAGAGRRPGAGRVAAPRPARGAPPQQQRHRRRGPERPAGTCRTT